MSNEDVLGLNASLSHLYPVQVDTGSNTCSVTLGISKVRGFLQALFESRNITEEQFKKISEEFGAWSATKGNALAGAPCADIESGTGAAKRKSSYKKPASEAILEKSGPCLATSSFFSKAEGAPVTKSPKLFFLPSIQKISRKLAPSQLQRSSFRLQLSDGSILPFQIHHDPSKKYPNGSFAEKVKKGYDEGGSTPKYAIKILKKRDLAAAIQIVKRNVICLRLLGLKGEFFFRNAKLYIFTDWIRGETLFEIKKKDLETLNLSVRVKLALDLIKQVATLHNNGIVHGDIKPENIIISSGKINLLDFDGARYIGEKSNNVIYTQEFVNPTVYSQIKQQKYGDLNTKSDIYALGVTLASLFPDLFKVSSVIYTHKENYKQKICMVSHCATTKELETIQKALFDFIKGLTEPNNLEPMTYFYEKLYGLYLDIFKEVLPEGLDLATIPKGDPMFGKTMFDEILTESKVLIAEIEEQNRSNEALSQLKM